MAVEAGRRARGQLRRYCAANRLNRLGTLTYAGAGCHDPYELRRDLADFFRALRRDYVRSFAYVWVPEWHAQGHGLHAHFAVGRFLPLHRIRHAWGRGFIHIKELGDLPTHSGPVEEARLAARYLAKYVAKDLGADTSAPERRRVEGLHRYEVAQGFQPRSVLLRGRSRTEILDLASDRMGAEPSYLWLSDDAAEWYGPPAVWASWDA